MDCALRIDNRTNELAIERAKNETLTKQMDNLANGNNFYVSGDPNRPWGDGKYVDKHKLFEFMTRAKQLYTLYYNGALRDEDVYVGEEEEDREDRNTFVRWAIAEGDGEALRWGTADLRADRTMVLESVKMSRAALRFASPDLRVDAEVLAAARDRK